MRFTYHQPDGAVCNQPIFLGCGRCVQPAQHYTTLHVHGLPGTVPRSGAAAVAEARVRVPLCRASRRHRAAPYQLTPAHSTNRIAAVPLRRSPPLASNC